jgi:hypothetical protein
MIIRASGFSPTTLDTDVPIIGYQNLVTTTGITATTSNSDFPIANVANPATHLKWKSGVNTGSEIVEIVIGGVSIDYVAIAKHNFGTIGCQITLEATVDTSSPYTGYVTLVSATTITDDLPLIFQFTPATYGAIRLTITSSSDTFREAAVIYVGTLLTFERSIKVSVDHTPINLGRDLDVFNGMSESGQFIGRIVRKEFFDTKAEFSYFTNAWYRASFDPFVVAAKETPFFWAWAPNSYSRDTGFGWLTKMIAPAMHLPTQRFNATIEMRAVA